MKSTIFREVLNEELIEVSKSVPETIQCMREQSGVSHDTTPDDMSIYFQCSKKGKISVRSSSVYMGRSSINVYQIYYVYGSVISQNNKTYVKITSVYQKSDIWWRIFSVTMAVLFVTIFFLSLCLEGKLNIPVLLVLLTYVFIEIGASIKSTSIRKNCRSEIVTLLENEIKKRVRNIEHWDD